MTALNTTCQGDCIYPETNDESYDMMATDKPAKNDDGRRSNDEAELRMKAVKRSWICPGAGFALVGNRTYAVLTFVASLCILPAVAWLAFQPTTTSLRGTGDRDRSLARRTSCDQEDVASPCTESILS